MISIAAQDFDGWRNQARALLGAGTRPELVIWTNEPALFDSSDQLPAASAAMVLPRSFVAAAEKVALHSNPSRWMLLYRIAWRILNENRDLMTIEIDNDISALLKMRKAVETDIYKMRAFVRFRKIAAQDGEQYVAWYAPDHDTLRANAEFFVKRFGGMRWAILSPQRSLVWDLHELHNGPGVSRSKAPADDELEELFRVYYSAIYNPARLNPAAMKAQLPVRRWKDLPEAQAISTLIRESRGRVDEMTSPAQPLASTFVPPNPTLPILRQSISRCRACNLCSRASGPVFGEGAEDAQIVLVGEQPGEEEDRAQRPFVGPAGQVLDAALEEAGLPRTSVWITNAVKAFRFEERGKRRIHQTPKATDIATCRPWLEAELSLLKPEVVVCLGGSAAQSVLGRTAAIGKERGRLIASGGGKYATVTYHPSAILRTPDEAARKKMMEALVQDLSLARSVAPVGRSAGDTLRSAW